MKSRNRLSTSLKTKVSVTTKLLAGTAGATVFIAGALMMLGGTTTNTVAPGVYSSSSVWSAGIPGSSDVANFNHSLTLDQNISVSGGGYYTVNAPLSDVNGGGTSSLSVSGDASDGVFEVNANTTFEGTCNVNNQGELIVRSGDTLRVGNTVFDNGSFVTVDPGGVLIINGDLQNKNNSDQIVVNGTLIVNGNFSGGNGSVISGSGNVTTTGSMSGDGTVFGSSPLACSGPCSGRSLSGFTNTISSDQTLCSGQTPSTLTGATSASSPAYQWQKSTDNATYSNISGATAASYSPGSLTTTTYYRRIVTSGGQSSTSASVKITINTSGIWTGAVSSNWNATGNWCGGVIPSSTSDVVIKAGSTNMPSIPSGTFNCNNITINSGASLTLQSGCTLNVKGSMINLGTITDNGATTVFNGSVPQFVTGVNSLKNVTVNNSYGLTLASSLTVTGIIKLLNGALVSNGLLTVNLDAGGIAYASTDQGSIYGNITVKKSVTSSQFHYLSAPLAGQTIGSWSDNVPLNWGSYYYYDETNTSTDYNNGWTVLSSTGTALTPMMGYALYFTNSAVMDNTGPYTHGASYSISVKHTYTGTNGADGWNLVGNPFPSTLDWDLVTGTWTASTHLNKAIYCWDPVNNRYTTYINGVGTNGGSKNISPMQGFWIRVDTAQSVTSATLQITSQARSTATSKFYRQAASQENPLLRLALTNDTYDDETVVRFMDQATEDNDGDYDALKMINDGDVPSLYTLSKGNQYAVNSLSSPQDEMEIPVALHITGPGSFKIEAREMQFFGSSYSVYFVDKQQNTTTDLNQTQSYAFSASPTDDPGRFSLKIKRVASATATDPNTSGTTADNSTMGNQITTAVTSGTSAEDAGIRVNVQDKTLYVRSSNGTQSASMAIYTTGGNEIASFENLSLGSEFTYDMSRYEPGMYIVKISTGKNGFTKKVILQ